MRFLSLLLPVFTLAVNAVLTNHTVDDTSPLLSYNQKCSNCASADALGFDTGRLNAGTVTTLSDLDAIPSSLQFNFTGELHTVHRTAIYIFIAIPAVGTPTTDTSLDARALPVRADSNAGVAPYVGPRGPGEAAGQGGLFTGTSGAITLDGFVLANNPTFPLLAAAQYSHCLWFTTGLADGPHSLKLETSKTALMIDSIVYTSNDPNLSSSGTPTVVSTIGTVSSSTSSGSPTSLASHHKAPVGAIAGGVIGGTALILAFLVGWILSRRKKHTNGPTTPAMQESASLQDHPLLTQSPSVAILTATKTEPPSQDAVSAEQFRLLQEQVRQLSQQRAGSSTAGTSVAGSDTASLGRSLSTMKREQTRALVEHGERGEGVTDTLVHTDSGLRLTAGRTVDELPPTYVAD
ncbi:hypothetical protein C8R46DRAFT_1342498 [Mycena filopes]|nr:hypothetical protein C8R46DRAFT_1342498 [Mycena filopes]